jgi:hypothetical protein
VTQVYRHLQVDRKGDVFCVRLTRRTLTETEVLELADELIALVAEGGCRRMALFLGPENVYCLYSVFLAKLVTLRRRLLEVDGRLKICAAGPSVVDVFEAAQLDQYFDFVPDEPAALAALQG